jgi:hypothetical protein
MVYQYDGSMPISKQDSLHAREREGEVIIIFNGRP